MNLEGPKGNEEKRVYDEDFRLMYLLRYLDEAEAVDYEERYFSDKKEAERLRRTESILLYEYTLGLLPDIHRRPIKHLLFGPKASAPLIARMIRINGLPRKQALDELEELRKLQI